jgi:AcrR family transcriptional regulator
LARPRAATYDDQREQILARAAELFARQGYTGTTMNQVAAACGVSKPTLYHYFTDKQSLLLHIAAGHVARLEALAREVQACRWRAEARLRTLIERFMARLCRRAARAPRADRGRALPARRRTRAGGGGRAPRGRRLRRRDRGAAARAEGPRTCTSR